jgi:hypothetical protein
MGRRGWVIGGRPLGGRPAVACAVFTVNDAVVGMKLAQSAGAGDAAVSEAEGRNSDGGRGVVSAVTLKNVRRGVSSLKGRLWSMTGPRGEEGSGVEGALIVVHA